MVNSVHMDEHVHDVHVSKLNWLIVLVWMGLEMSHLHRDSALQRSGSTATQRIQCERTFTRRN